MKSASLSLLLLAGVAGGASAATLVVRSSGPSAKMFPAGKALPDGAKLTLKASDQVVILDGRGTRTLKGPGTFDPRASTSSADATRTTIATVVGQTGKPRARIGAVRGGVVAVPTRSPNIWFVDVTKSSSICVADPASLTLWRADTEQGQAMTVTGPAGSANIQWAPGQSAAAWPSSLKIASGQEYQLSAGAAQPTRVRFALLGANPSDLEGTASALIQNGCTAQLDLLIETVALPEPAQPAAG